MRKAGKTPLNYQHPEFDRSFNAFVNTGSTVTLQPGPTAEAEATTIPYKASTPTVPPRPVVHKQLLTPEAFTLQKPVPSTIPKVKLVPPPPPIPIPVQPSSQIPLIPLPPQPAPVSSKSAIGSMSQQQLHHSLHNDSSDNHKCCHNTRSVYEHLKKLKVTILKC